MAKKYLAQPYTDNTTCFVVVVVLKSAIREGRHVINRGMTVKEFAHSTLYLPVDCGPRKDP